MIRWSVLRRRPDMQGQVDFAHFRLPWGRRWALLVVLGYSRLLWLRFFRRQTMETLFTGLEQAFAYFEGVPHELLFDQMRSVIVKDERLRGGALVENAEFLRFANHWAFRARACRAYRAKTKGKVERPIRYVRENFFYGRSFLNDDDLNVQALQWLEQVANVRMHGTTNERPIERFDREERMALNSLAAKALSVPGALADSSAVLAAAAYTAAGGAATTLEVYTRWSGGAMKAVATSRREQIRWMLADLKMPGALEAVDGILSKADGGSVTAAEAIQELLGAQIGLRNNRRLAGSHALLTVARGEDARGVRLLLPALDQARTDRQPRRVELPGAQGERRAAGAPGGWQDSPCYRLGHRCRSERPPRLLRNPGRSGYLTGGGPGGRCSEASPGSAQRPVADGRRRDRVPAVEPDRCRSVLPAHESPLRARLHRMTSNKGFEEWGEVLGDEVMAAALIDRILHHCHIVNIRGNSYRMRQHTELWQALRQGSEESGPGPRRRAKEGKA